MKSLILAGACCALMSAAPAAAGSILWISDSGGNLVTVDVATGSATVIGNSRVALTDIAFSPAGELYGLAFADLYRVDTTTAAVTFVGDVGFSGNALVFGADGTLYGASSVTANLYTIDPTTGASTFIGNTGGASSGDLAFVGDALYLAANTSPADTLRRIDLGPPVTNALVGPLGFDNVYGMARADDGVLYGVSADDIFAIDLATGAGTLSTSYSYAGQGDAYGTTFLLETKPPVIPGGPSVPEPATWAMLIGGFAMAGTVLRRRHRTLRLA